MNCVTGLMASQSALRFQLRLSIAFHPTKRPQNVLQYTCKYNQCNGNRVLERMEALIDQIYNVTSIWEGMGYQKQPNTPTSSSQPTIASTLTTKSQLSNGLTTDERVSSATTEDTQETDIPSRMESEAMSTMEVATTYAAEMETTSIIEIEAIPMMEIDTTSNIHESEVHTELSTNPLPVSTDAVAETTTVEITLVDTSIQSSETISTATTTFDVITSDGVYLTDTEVIDSSTEPITANDAGQIRSPDINMTVIVLVLSYLRLL